MLVKLLASVEVRDQGWGGKWTCGRMVEVFGGPWWALVHHGGGSGCLWRYWLDTVVHHGGEGVYKTWR